MTTVSQMRVFYPYGRAFRDPWPNADLFMARAWNGFRKLGSTHICATGSRHSVPLHQAVLKEAEQKVILLSLYSPFRSPLWWPYSCWLRSVTMTSSTLQSTNVRCLWTSSVPYPGVYVRLLTLDWDLIENYSRELTFGRFFYFTENVLCVIYLPGRWILRSLSTCTTFCELLWIKCGWRTVTVRQKEDLHT